MSAGHGTPSGYHRHWRTGEPICDACREARATYARELRAKNPKAYTKEKRMSAANSRALWRLAALYPAEFHILAEEERRKAREAAA